MSEALLIPAQPRRSRSDVVLSSAEPAALSGPNILDGSVEMDHSVLTGQAESDRCHIAILQALRRIKCKAYSERFAIIGHVSLSIERLLKSLHRQRQIHVRDCLCHSRA